MICIHFTLPWKPCSWLVVPVDGRSDPTHDRRHTPSEQVIGGNGFGLWLLLLKVKGFILLTFDQLVQKFAEQCLLFSLIFFPHILLMCVCVYKNMLTVMQCWMWLTSWWWWSKLEWTWRSSGWGCCRYDRRSEACTSSLQERKKVQGVQVTGWGWRQRDVLWVTFQAS